MKMAAVKLKFDQKSGWLSKILNFCSEDAKVVFTAVTVSILFKSFWADSRSIPLSSMALTLDVGGGSSLVAVNHGLRTCSGDRLSSAWWVWSWAAVNLVLARFFGFGSARPIDVKPIGQAQKGLIAVRGCRGQQ
nr:putative thylakoidal processing peptidase 2, chloroplastic [Quercus suber]